MQIRTFFYLAAGAAFAASAGACMVDRGETTTSTSGGGEGGAGASGGSGFGGEGAGGFGGTGGEGGFGGGSTGNDLCPGDPYDIGVGDTLELPGSTVGLDLDSGYASYCGIGTGSGLDAVYAFTATGSGTLLVSLESSNGLNGVLYAQQSCGDPSPGSFINCQDQGDGTEAFAFDAQEGQVYYVFVDGRDQTAGDYVLTASLQAGICGDGVINQPAEDCDFGDTNPGDGCDPSCQFEPVTDLSDTCVGEGHFISPGVTTVITSFTTGYTDDYANYGSPNFGYQDSAANNCVGSGVGSPDRVFYFVPQASGTLTVSLPNLGAAGGGFDGVLAVWDNVCDPSVGALPPYVGCSDALDGAATETITFPVEFGHFYYVVVDGYASFSYGNFELTAELN